MSQQLPTVQDLYNVKTDADDLAAMVNGGSGTTVTTRYGGTKPSVAKAVADALALLNQFTNTGPWQSGYSYQVNDIWSDATGAWYIVVADYVSGGSASADAASSAVIPAGTGAASRFKGYDSVSSACLAVSAGLHAEGEIIDTEAYYAGYNVGGNRYRVVKAVSEAARPAEDKGSVIWCGSTPWYLLGFIGQEIATPEQFGLLNGLTYSDHLTGFANYTGLTKVIARDLAISEPLRLNSSYNSLEIRAGATLSATPDFVGDGVVIVGSDSKLVDNSNVVGEGSIDAMGVAPRGVFFNRARFSKVTLQSIKGATVNGIKVGSFSAGGKCYEINIKVDEIAHTDTPNAANSIGVYHEKVSDCNVEQTIVRGYRKAFGNTSSCAAIWYRRCHGWIRPEHGVFTHCYDDNAALSKFIACYADTPTNYADNTITDVYGFYLNGFSPQLTCCEVFINGDLTPSIETDGVIHAVYMAKEIYGNLFGLHLSGGQPTRRFKSAVGGYTKTSNILGVIDNGANTIVDTDSRKNAFSDVKDVEFNRAINVQEGVNLTGPQGVNRALRFQRDGANRFTMRMNEDAESGADIGSLLQWQSYDNTGALLDTILQYSRQYKQWQLSGKLKVSDLLILSECTTATLPDNDNRGVVYVSDGHNGAPCLAVYSGGWKKILLGDVITPT